MDVRILRAGPDDAARLEQVADDVFDAPVAASLLSAYLAEPRHLMVLALSGGVVVGQARGIVHLAPDQPPELYIDNMGVTPARQREGIASRLLAELLDWGREQGCDTAWLGTETDNVAARALYERGGGRAAVMAVYAFGDEAT